MSLTKIDAILSRAAMICTLGAVIVMPDFATASAFAVAVSGFCYSLYNARVTEPKIDLSPIIERMSRAEVDVKQLQSGQTAAHESIEKVEKVAVEAQKLLSQANLAVGFRPYNRRAANQD